MKRLFIGSSTESIEIAYAIQENLDYDVEPVVWTQGIFSLSNTALHDLVRELENMDYAVFVFAPDDITVMTQRNQQHNTVRDNVVFELGLAIGKLGIDNVFFVVPRDQDLHLPTDLMGITPATYKSDRADGNIQAALGPACSKIRKEIRKSSSPSDNRKKDGSAPAQSKTQNKKSVLAGTKNNANNPELVKVKVTYDFSGVDDEYEAFDRLTREIMASFRPLKKVTLSAVFYSMFLKNSRCYPNDVMNNDVWHDITEAQADGEVILDTDNNEILPNTDNSKVRNAMGKLKELKQFIENMASAEFYEAFEARESLPLDLSKKPFWERILQARIIIF